MTIYELRDLQNIAILQTFPSVAAHTPVLVRKRKHKPHPSII